MTTCKECKYFEPIKLCEEFVSNIRRTTCLPSECCMCGRENLRVRGFSARVMCDECCAEVIGSEEAKGVEK